MGPTGISPLNISLVTSTELVEPHHETVQVQLAETGALPKIDVYFLADTTSSMGPVIGKVSEGAGEIMRQLTQQAGEVGADVWFGVGNYRDLDYAKDEWFTHQVPLTGNPDRVKEGISNWKAAPGGQDIAEGQFYALDKLAQPPDGSIGWRADSKRIIVWIGDAPGHDPICRAASGETYEITERSVTEKLKQQGIFVLAISTPSGSMGPGLDVDPASHGRSEGEKYKTCGVGGEAGQATRIAAETRGGPVSEGIRPDRVVEEIIHRGGERIRKIESVTLKPDKKIAPFVRVQPPAQGPFESVPAKPLQFTLTFPGTKASTAPAPPSGAAPVTVEGRIDVKVDGVTTGSIPVKIAVPDLSGVYTIQSTLSHLNLQLENPSYSKPGGNVTQNVATGRPPEQWELIAVPGGGYHIKNEDVTPLLRYLEVARSSKENNAEILTRDESRGKNKEWFLIPVGASDAEGLVFKVQNANSGQVLDVKGQSKEPGTRIVQHSYWGNWPEYQQDHNEHWYLRHVD